MSNVSNAEYIITTHARQRIKERLGIESIEVASAWVAEQLRKASRSYKDEHRTNYVTDMYEIVTDGLKIVTVKPKGIAADYMTKLTGMLSREIEKELTKVNRELRKIEITVAEHTLNQLKARNPRTKDVIQTKLLVALEEKARIENEVKSVQRAAEKFGLAAIS